MEEKQEKPLEEQLRDYLARDLANVKLRLNDSRRSFTKLLYLSFALVLLLAVCVGGFTTSVYFITQSHTKQMRAIFDNVWEAGRDKEKSSVYQDTGYGGNAVANVNSSVNSTQSDITQEIHSPEGK